MVCPSAPRHTAPRPWPRQWLVGLLAEHRVHPLPELGHGGNLLGGWRGHGGSVVAITAVGAAIQRVVLRDQLTVQLAQFGILLALGLLQRGVGARDVGAELHAELEL